MCWDIERNPRRNVGLTRTTTALWVGLRLSASDIYIGDLTKPFEFVGHIIRRVHEQMLERRSRRSTQQI